MGMEKAEFQWFTRCFIMSRKWVFFVLGGRASTGRGSISTGNEQYVGSTGCWSLGIARLEQGRQRALLRSWSSEQTGKLLLQRLSGVYQRQIWGSTEMLRDLSQLPQAFLSPSTLCPGKGLGGLRVCGKELRNSAATLDSSCLQGSHFLPCWAVLEPLELCF